MDTLLEEGKTGVLSLWHLSRPWDFSREAALFASLPSSQGEHRTSTRGPVRMKNSCSRVTSTDPMSKTPVAESRCTSWWVNDLFGSPLMFSDCTWYLCRVHYWKHASRISFDSDYDSSSRSGYYGWKIKNSMISLSFRFFSIICFYKILNIGPVLYSRPLFFILYVVMCAIIPKLLSIPTLLPFWYPMAIFYVYKSVSFL